MPHTITNHSIQSALSSYMGYPRIHFAGQFRADPNTRNNDFCNFRPDQPPNPDLNNLDWNANGTNEFEFFDSKITGVVYQDGTLSTSDPIVGHKIIDNLDGPPAKMVDPNFMYGWHTVVFGLKFGVRWNGVFPERDGDIAFHGNWSRNLITQYAWVRMMCYNFHNHGPYLLQNAFHKAAQGKTFVRDVAWGHLGGSEALRQLREAAGDGPLDVRVSLFYPTTNYPPYVAHNASLGYVVGAIGVPGPSDTLNVPGERSMYFKENPVELSFRSGDLCYQQDYSTYNDWANMAPFELDRERREVRIDLSNSLPADLSNSLYDLGILRVGVLMDSCVRLLGDERGLPYAPTEELPVTSAIYGVSIEESYLVWAATHRPLVLAQVLISHAGSTPVCNYHGGPWRTAQILLQEDPYFVRPVGLYSDFLDKKYHPTSSQTVYVTKYGRPLVGVPVTAVQQVLERFTPYPESGVIPTPWTAVTDGTGHARFVYKINESAVIPDDRHFSYSVCLNSAVSPDTSYVVPVPNQPYYFVYCVEVAGADCSNSVLATYMLAYSDGDYTRPYTWTRDVGPIFKLHAHLAPVMKRILDLSSYNQVTLPRNIHLLNRTLRLDMDHPSYMPTTRDLPPAARDMILEWLEDPKYDISGSSPPISVGDEFSAGERPWAEQFGTTYDDLPPRCKHSGLHFQDEPHQHDSYFDTIFWTIRTENALSRPLLGSVDGVTSVDGVASVNGVSGSISGCSIENVKKQLQLAIELEWATIPVYLTSLYSIKDGHNTEIYNLTRSIVTQEMLHMTQSANILIAMHGSPLIDDPSTIPSFPITGLPGGVLPHLRITLEKFSLEHVYRVFLGIEVPQKSLVVSPPLVDPGRVKHTIGMFYNEIKACIAHLGDDIFDPLTADRQVQWPWVPTDEEGLVIPVTDAASAERAIDVIVSQGEGASILDPDEIGSHTLAHFFKFEEIVCQRHLEKVDDFHYAYVGAPIPFDPSGVWPMRPNPMASTVLPETNCYTEARIFHRVYRSLLRKLQQVFNGHAEDILETVYLMESLQGHAKRLMWIEYRPEDPDDDSTCGPVWDYFWPDH